MTRKTPPTKTSLRPQDAGRSLSLTRRSLLGGLLLTPFAGLAARAAEAALKLTAEDRGDLNRVASYLNGIHTFSAGFQQISSGGGLATGKIYLRRPGMLRVEYAPPVPVLLVADGFWVSYYDSQLDQLTQIPISQTPIWFLVQETIAFTPKITVTRIERSPGAIRLSMYQTDHPDAGSASLVFADEPLQLKQWTIRDSQGTEVQIALQDAVFGAQLSNDLFAAPQTRRMRNGGKD
jgi:outer membrane lipoprotein-sorting protein